MLEGKPKVIKKKDVLNRISNPEMFSGKLLQVKNNVFIGKLAEIDRNDIILDKSTKTSNIRSESKSPKEKIKEGIKENEEEIEENKVN